MGAQKKDESIKFIIDKLELKRYKESNRAERVQAAWENSHTESGWRWAPSYEMLANIGEQQDGSENEKGMDGYYR